MKGSLDVPTLGLRRCLRRQMADDPGERHPRQAGDGGTCRRNRGTARCLQQYGVLLEGGRYE